MKGEPKLVTTVEREAFVATFDKQLRYLSWFIVPATVLLIVVLALFGPGADSQTSETVIYLGVGAIVSLFLVGYYHAWNAPARALERRPALGSPLTRDEARRLALTRITYGQLALCIPLVGLLLFKISDRWDVLHGWGRLWLLGSGILIIAAAIQAFRKWSLERES